MSRYTPLTERTKHLEVQGWSWNGDQVRFSGREPNARAGQVHQVVLHLEQMDENDLYNMARWLMNVARGLEEYACSLLDSSMQDEIPLP